jgi:hypothetical protein
VIVSSVVSMRTVVDLPLVGTQKAEDLAGTDLQVQPAHRLDGPLATV